MTTIYNISKTKVHRQELRKQDITCEKILWSKLKGKQQEYKFRRQYGVGNFIVDFYCPKVKLAIEIDGSTHGTDEEIEYDIARTKFIESFKITVKRYLNIDVNNFFKLGAKLVFSSGQTKIYQLP
jgi:very-short-patch-repair endonuclease